MSRQSGVAMKKLDAASLEEIHEDEIEQMYQQAVKYRYRVETNVMPLAEQTKAVMFGHLVNVLTCCNVFRGRWLSAQEERKHRAELAKKRKNCL